MCEGYFWGETEGAKHRVYVLTPPFSLEDGAPQCRDTKQHFVQQIEAQTKLTTPDFSRCISRREREDLLPLFNEMVRDARRAKRLFSDVVITSIK